MQAGALCPTGTVGVLKLSGPKVQTWLDAVGKYNDTVENATKQLKADAKGILTPAQVMRKRQKSNCTPNLTKRACRISFGRRHAATFAVL